MDWHTPAHSTQISRYAFDPVTGELHVVFHQKRPGPVPTYVYKGNKESGPITQELFDEFHGHPSKGSFHHQRIKGVFPFEKRIPPEAESG
ncbi:MAG: KTSC domain-containing protein [Patescibacteria group bacterium]|nr:KTSC domain-containing protein [Patescibacteria group bacterium]